MNTAQLTRSFENLPQDDPIVVNKVTASSEDEIVAVVGGEGDDFSYEEEIVETDDELYEEENDTSKVLLLEEDDTELYEEITVGEDEDWLTDDGMADDDGREETILEISKASNEILITGSDLHIDDLTSNNGRCCDDSSVALDSVDSTFLSRIDSSHEKKEEGNKLQFQMESAITEGARKAALEQAAREEMLKKVAEQRRKQRELLGQETARLRSSYTGTGNKQKTDPTSCDHLKAEGLGRNILLHQIQRINEAVKKNERSSQIPTTGYVDTDEKKKALAQLKREAARIELARTNFALGKSTHVSPSSKINALSTQSSPRSVSEQQTIEYPVHTESPAKQSSWRLSKVSEVPSIPWSTAAGDDQMLVNPGFDPSLPTFHSSDQSTISCESSNNSSITANTPKLAPDTQPKHSSKVATEVGTEMDVGCSKAGAMRCSSGCKLGHECAHQSGGVNVECNKQDDVDGGKTEDNKRELHALDAATDDSSKESLPSVCSKQGEMRLPKRDSARSLIETSEKPEDNSNLYQTHATNSKNVIAKIASIASQPMPVTDAESIDRSILIEASSKDRVSSPVRSRRPVFSKKMSDKVPSMFRAAQILTSPPESANCVPAEPVDDGDGEYYCLEQLQGGKLEGVDIRHRETYLSPSVFQFHFNMSKEEFAKLPKWKRDKAKRALKLF